MGTRGRDVCEEIQHGDEKIVVLFPCSQQEDFDPRGKKRWLHHHYVSSKSGGPTEGVLLVRRVEDGVEGAHACEVDGVEMRGTLGWCALVQDLALLAREREEGDALRGQDICESDGGMRSTDQSAGRCACDVAKSHLLLDGEQTGDLRLVRRRREIVPFVQFHVRQKENHVILEEGEGAEPIGHVMLPDGARTAADGDKTDRPVRMG